MLSLPNNQKFPLYISCLSDIFFLLFVAVSLVSCCSVLRSVFILLRVFLVACHDAIFKDFDPLSSFAMYLMLSLCIRPCSCSCYYIVSLSCTVRRASRFKYSYIPLRNFKDIDWIQAQRKVFGILKQSDMITFGPSYSIFD